MGIIIVKTITVIIIVHSNRILTLQLRCYCDIVFGEAQKHTVGPRVVQLALWALAQQLCSQITALCFLSSVLTADEHPAGTT
jgi:hypothetical protein